MRLETLPEQGRVVDRIEDVYTTLMHPEVHFVIYDPDDTLVDRVTAALDLIDQRFTQPWEYTIAKQQSWEARDNPQFRSAYPLDQEQIDALQEYFAILERPHRDAQRILIESEVRHRQSKHEEPHIDDTFFTSLGYDRKTSGLYIPICQTSLERGLVAKFGKTYLEDFNIPYFVVESGQMVFLKGHATGIHHPHAPHAAFDRKKRDLVLITTSY